MTSRAVLNIIYGFLILLALGAGGYAVYSYQSMSKQVAKIDEYKQEAEDAKAAVNKLSEEVVRKADLDAAIRSRRQTVHIQLDKVTNEDPVSRDYLSEPIPDGVRNAILSDRPVSETVPDRGATPVP